MTTTQLQPAQALIDTQDAIVDAFELFDDWTDRYQYIIDLGRKLQAFPEAEKTEDNRLKGCQSQVWIIHEMRGESLHFEAVSDSTIVSGLIALLLKVYSDRKPGEILSTPPDFIARIGLDGHLSPTRSNGLAAMVQQIRQIAVAAMVEQQNNEAAGGA